MFFSEKSWILERRKTPKVKKSSKTYKASRKMKEESEQKIEENTESEDLDEDNLVKDGQNVGVRKMIAVIKENM